MSDIKSPVSRIHVGRTESLSDAAGKPTLGRLRSGLPTHKGPGTYTRPGRKPTTTVLVSEFIAPPRETAEWLGNPAMPAALAAVSVDLAPDGMASSKRNQYVASVVETHLAARKRLARHLNALLRA